MRILFIFILINHSGFIFAQSSHIDSLMQRFLLENKEVDTIIYKISKSKNKSDIERNYFNNKVFVIHSRNCSITGHKFGSNSSLRKRFILIDDFNNPTHKYFFFGKDGLENDINSLLAIFCSEKCSFSDADKRKIFQSVTDIYIEEMLSTNCGNKGSIL